MPFRHAHEIIGKLTAHSLATGTAFPDIPLDQYKEFSPVFDATIYKVLTLDHAVAARKATGAPSPANVARELTAWQPRLATAPRRKGK